MSGDVVVQIGQQALMVVLLVAAPMLGLGLMVGLAVSIFQTTTSIQEQTLIFIPKILAVFTCVVLLAPWIGQQMLVMTQGILGQLERFIQ